MKDAKAETLKPEPPKTPAPPAAPVMGADALAVEPYIHDQTRRTVAFHDGGHAFTATGIPAGPAQPSHNTITQ